MQIVVAVALGGAVGALSRLGVSVLLRDVLGPFPLGTLLINVSGCLVFGLCWALHDGGWSRLVAACVFTGFLGAFTTFSTFAFESIQLLEEDRPGLFVLNLIANNVLGGLAMLGGLAIGRSL